MVEVRISLWATLWPVLLKVRLGVLEVACAGWVASSYGALLEMSLKNITARKSIFTQMALIGPLSSVYELLVTNSSKRRCGNSRRSRCRFRCFKCRYVLLQ